MRFLLALSATVSLVFAPLADLPKIGERFDIAMRDGYITVHGRRPPCPYINKIYAGIQFKFAVDPDEILIYIITDDPHFRTPEGLGVKASLNDVLAAGGHSVINEEGFHRYSQLPSGWYAAFPNSPHNSLGLPFFETPTELKVTSFFRR